MKSLIASGPNQKLSDLDQHCLQGDLDTGSER